VCPQARTFSEYATLSCNPGAVDICDFAQRIIFVKQLQIKLYCKADHHAPLIFFHWCSLSVRQQFCRGTIIIIIVVVVIFIITIIITITVVAVIIIIIIIITNVFIVTSMYY
jgi:hypothetical protein